MNTIRRILVAALCGLVLVSGTVIGPAGMARAAEPNGTLTVIKTLGEGDTPGTPLEGIVVQVNQVLGVSVNDPEAVADLVATDPEVLVDGGRYELGAPITTVTNSDGAAKATGLTDGVYLVREIPQREEDVAYSVVSPFLAAVGADGDRDVTVHAKNQIVSITLADSAEVLAPGDRYRMTTTSTVPAPDREGNLHRYSTVIDPHPLLVGPDGSGEPVVGRVWIDAGRRIELVPGDDYAVTTGRDGKLRVDFTDDALERLAALRSQPAAGARGAGVTPVAADRPGVQVHVEVDAAVTEEAVGMTFDSIARLYPDGRPVPDDWPSNAGAPVMSQPVTVRVLAPSELPPVEPTPSESGTPEPCPDCEGSRPGLPKTGAAGPASVGGASALGGGLVLFGWWRRRREREAAESVDDENEGRHV